MKAKSTLRVYNKDEIITIPGVVKGQTLKVLIGSNERPSERVRATVATFKPGTHELLHWHAIEVFIA